MSSRRHSRERALQVLFQWDIHGHTRDWLADFWVHNPIAPDARAFADRIIDGVMAHRAELDELIGTYATNWSVPRMPIVDRNILRAGLYELLYMPDVPAKVTVNEAVELAKEFADEETRKFVNGILDHVIRGDPRLEDKRAQMEETGAAKADGVKRGAKS